jgi:hypothetical protein
MKKIILVAALLSAAVCLPAQNKGGNKSGGINLSLWKKACTQPLDSTQTTYVNLGLFSAMHKLHGVGFNAFGSMVQNNMNGVQISGLANLAGGSMHGVQIGGISNVNGNNLAGLSVSGLVNITGNKAKGVLITGLSNIAGDNMRGLMMSGIMNITGDKAAGVQLAGLANVTGEEYDGLVDMYERTRSEGFGDEVKRRIMLGTFVLSSGFYDAYYKKAKLVQKRIMQEFASQFADVDVIATPTVPSTAFKIGENTDDPLKMYANDVCTVTVNIAGLPAISIPCAYDDKGLPVGMQLIGGKFTEQRLLNTAYAYEQLVGGFKMPEL